MINISERAKQHLFRFALGFGTAVIFLLFIAIMPWFVIKGMFFIAMAALFYLLGLVIQSAYEDFKEIQKLEEEIETKKDKR
jgi:uncharacterized membrane protein